ncbi:hypothetical protein EZL74_11085 [Flavobacterium silvisoli]|uniref:Uncharacterized protein n=1 Tax=Flavobacterium silvisoli TaxID=2529433 RepID=A0A4Q9YRW9_9FLAO|nr:hypothetical protein [Flavobacterium silvisoli]TBX66125.1 hypothetical protein EZL74_11085 [Flavobacterium silvisoli]
MKTIIAVNIIFFLLSCSPNFQKDFTVYRKDKTYKMLINYTNDSKDSISIHWLQSYQIENNTNRDVKFDWIRKRPEYIRQMEEENINDSLVLFNRKILKKTKRELLVNCSKIVSVKNIPNNITDNNQIMFSFRDFKSNITHIPQAQLEFQKSIYFQNILKEIENDSIAIVFRDTVTDDYFQFKGIVKDKMLKFSR